MFEVANDQSSPRVRQLTIFLSNRLGALLKVIRILEAKEIRVCGISLLDSAEHVVVRMIVDRPTIAMETLEGAGVSVFESEILGVAMDHEKGMGIRRILSALLLGEVNVNFTYAMMVCGQNNAALAISTEDMDSAARVLSSKGIELIGQEELESRD